MSAAEQNAQKVAQVYAKATQLRAAYPTDALTVTAEQFETIKNGTDITLEQFNALPEMSDEDHDHGHDHDGHAPPTRGPPRRPRPWPRGRPSTPRRSGWRKR